MTEALIMILRLLGSLLVAGLGVVITLFVWAGVSEACKLILGIKP
jgi:hypothetical protein